ncbi:hypothetical protein DICPUDRAFT_20023, partial [Dictyostelium purpureum]
RIILALIICSILVCKVVIAGTGIDISSPTSKTVTSTQWSCLAKQNTKAIIQVWSGGYGYNTNIASSVSAAKSAGIQTVDLYAFLCSQCSGNSPSSSAIKTLVSNLRSQNVEFGTLWIDVEQCSNCWGSTSTNAQFVVEAVQTAQQLGVSVGVYSSIGEWSQTVGSLNSLSSFPLWYAHYDNVPAFSDSSFYQFGSWSSPAMKQYAGNTQQCGVSVDLDFFQGGGKSSTTGGSSSGHHSGSSNSESSESSESSGKGSSSMSGSSNSDSNSQSGSSQSDSNSQSGSQSGSQSDSNSQSGS